MTRAQVPWSTVGNGWFAADSVKGGVNTLVLVAPSGQAYSIASLAQGEGVVSIAHDGRHVITARMVSGTFQHRVWDTAAGRVSANLPGDYVQYLFTRPSGSAIMGHNAEKGTYARFSTNGAATSKKSGVGALTDITANPDGLTAATTTSTRRVQLRTHSTFAVQRTYTLPAGYSGCTATGWADSSTLTMACTKGTLTQLFSQKINGGTPVAMTSGTADDPDADGWKDAVATSIGRVAIPTVNAAPDFVTSVYRFNATTPAQKIAMPAFNPDAGDFSNKFTVDRIVGNKVLLVTPQLGYDSPMQSIGQYDLATKKVNYLIGHRSQFGGTPGSYAMIDPRS